MKSNKFKFEFLSKAVLFFLLIHLYSLGGSAASNIATVRVVSVNGRATLKGKPLKSGESIALAETIKTEAGSGVKLLMPDKSILDLGPNTSFKVEQIQLNGDGSRNASLNLDFGSVRAAVTKKLDKKSNFTIRTKSSVLAVRGTNFAASWQQEGGKVNEKVTVEEGNVEVTPTFAPNARPVTVTAGKQFTATPQIKEGRVIASDPGSKTEEVKVASISQAEAAKVVSGSSVEDKTYIKSVDLSSVGDNKGESGRGAGTLTSVAIAVGAEERPRSRDPKSGQERASGEKSEEGKSEDSKGDDGGVPAADAAAAIAQDTPNGGVTDSTPKGPSNSGSSNVTVTVKMSSF